MNNNLKMKNNLASFISFIALALLAQVAFGGHREVSVLRCVQEGETIASVELSVSPGAEPVLLGVVRDAVDRGSDPADWAAYDPVVASTARTGTSLGQGAVAA